METAAFSSFGKIVRAYEGRGKVDSSTSWRGKKKQPTLPGPEGECSQHYHRPSGIIKEERITIR